MIPARALGRTGITLPALGFGCGAVGGLMVRGTEADQDRAVARALELGIRYFDTAPSYGDGASERNLGRVLAKLRPDVLVGTKVNLPPGERIAEAVPRAMEDSLRRLGRSSVDIYYLHNPIGSGDRAIPPERVIGEVAPAFRKLREAGKTRFLGFTAIGDTQALHAVVASGAFDAAQVPYNLLNPSAGGPMPPNRPGQDYGHLLEHMQRMGMGAVGIRILAGGALSGVEIRHPNASPPPDPIGSGPDYATDLSHAEDLWPMVEPCGAASLTELAVRFAISHPAMSTALIGIATPEQFEEAATAAMKGVLPPAALDRLRK